MLHKTLCSSKKQATRLATANRSRVSTRVTNTWARAGGVVTAVEIFQSSSLITMQNLFAVSHTVYLWCPTILTTTWPPFWIWAWLPIRNTNSRHLLTCQIWSSYVIRCEWVTEILWSKVIPRVTHKAIETDADDFLLVIQWTWADLVPFPRWTAISVGNRVFYHPCLFNAPLWGFPLQFCNNVEL